MKRLALRILALAAVLSLGYLTIAYAQRETNSSDPQTPNNASWGGPRSQGDASPGLPESNPLRGDSGEVTLEGPVAPDHRGEPVSPPANSDAYPRPGVATQRPAVSQWPAPNTAPPNSFGSPDGTAAPDPRGNETQAPPTSFATRPADDADYPTPAQAAGDRRGGSRQAWPRQNPAPPSYDHEPAEAAAGSYPAPSGVPAPAQFQSESPAPLAGYRESSYGDNPAPKAPAAANPQAFPAPPALGTPDRTQDPIGGNHFGARAQALEAAVGSQGTGRPANDRKLDGLQTPQLSIQKVAPEEIQVGKSAVFRVEVKNTGPVAAENVEIRDVVPEGTRLESTEPRAETGPRGELVWRFDKIEPGGGQSVEMRVMPTAEGEIGSVATVQFSASASTRTVATKPELAINVTSPKTVMIEGQMTLSITVTNSGSGVAHGVVLEEHVPACLKHPAGTELEYEVGDLAPNESKTLDLKLTAVEPGQAANLLIARADAVAEIKKELPIEVVAPKLAVAMSGPTRRYLERQATYELAISNPGTAPARNVRLTAELPRGLKFVSADKNAHYDPQTRMVHWAVAELPAGVEGTVQLTTLPVEMGQHRVQIQSTAEKAEPVQEEKEVLIDGIAAIRFEVRDVQDPIEVGGDTVYEIRVLNQGSKEATQVRIVAALSPGLELVPGDNSDEAGHPRMEGDYLVFDPIARLSPKADVTYRVRVRGSQPGDKRIRVQLTSAELQSPVTKEESTRVFSDR